MTKLSNRTWAVVYFAALFVAGLPWAGPVIASGVQAAYLATVPFGGTGLTSLTTHATLVGAGTGNVHLVGPGTLNQCFVAQGVSSDPIFTSCPGGGGTIATTTNTLTGDGAGNAIAAIGTGTNCVHVDGSSAACGGGGGGLTLIASTTVAMATPTVTFSMIPGTYKNLVLYVNGACDGMVDNTDIYLQFNGDSGSNYSRVFVSGTGGSVVAFSSVNGTPPVGYVSCASGTAGSAGGNAITIYDYTNTTFWKTVTGQTSLVTALTSPNFYAIQSAVSWGNTSAITSILIGCDGYNLVTGTTLSLYGF